MTSWRAVMYLLVALAFGTAAGPIKGTAADCVTASAI
jgi:hypothetical protein